MHALWQLQIKLSTYGFVYETVGGPSVVWMDIRFKETQKWEQEQQHREGTTNTRPTFPAAGAESALTASGRVSVPLADTERPQG